MVRNHQAIGFRQSVNKRTQEESPCRIPCFNCIGPILSFFSLILTSSVMDHFVMKLVIFVAMLCNCNVRASHLWLIESKAFFTSIHVQERFFFLSFASSSVVLSIIKLSMHPIEFVVHPL